MLSLISGLLALHGQAFGITPEQRARVITQLKEINKAQDKEIESLEKNNTTLKSQLVEISSAKDAADLNLKLVQDAANLQAKELKDCMAQLASAQITISHLWKWKMAGCILAGVAAGLIVLKFIMPVMNVPNAWVGIGVPAGIGFLVFLGALAL